METRRPLIATLVAELHAALVGVAGFTLDLSELLMFLAVNVLLRPGAG